MGATFSDNITSVATLLELGAEINCPDDNGDFVIHQAIHSHYDNVL